MPNLKISDLRDVAVQGRNYGKSNPFAGTSYEDMWENNPYKNLYYEPTFWDDIGLSNKSKDANSEYERLYNEYISGIYDQQRQDTYNSPTAESERMKAAGLNPDLLGLPGKGTNEMAPPNAGMNPALNGQSPAVNGFGILTSVLGFATASLKSINEIRGLSLSNESQDLINFGRYKEDARQAIINQYATRFLNPDDSSKWTDWKDLSDVNSLQYSTSRQRSRYKRAFTSVLGNESFKSSESAWTSLSADDKAMKHFISGIIDLELNYRKADLKGKTREANNKGWLDHWRNSFYKTLYDDWQNGSQLAGLMLIGSANKFNTFGISQIRGNSKSWLSSDINWNDSVIGGIGKKFGLW